MSLPASRIVEGGVYERSTGRGHAVVRRVWHISRQKLIDGRTESTIHWKTLSGPESDIGEGGASPLDAFARWAQRRHCPDCGRNGRSPHKGCATCRRLAAEADTELLADADQWGES